MMPFRPLIDNDLATKVNLKAASTKKTTFNDSVKNRVRPFALQRQKLMKLSTMFCFLLAWATIIYRI